MKSWELLRRAIQDGQCDDAAKKFGVGGDTVRRWRREPESDDAPLATGRANPLDRIEDLIDFVLLNNPYMARAVAEHALEYYLAKAETLELRGTVKSASGAALESMVQTANAISVDAPLIEIEEKFERADAHFQEFKRHIRAEYSRRNGNGLAMKEQKV
jgi:hypothetical protein